MMTFLKVRFANGAERHNRGFLKEWTLMLHGTKDAPYSDLPVTDPHQPSPKTPPLQTSLLPPAPIQIANYSKRHQANLTCRKNYAVALS